MNHGQQAGEVSLSGSGKEQSVRERDAVKKYTRQYLVPQYIHACHETKGCELGSCQWAN